MTLSRRPPGSSVNIRLLSTDTRSGSVVDARQFRLNEHFTDVVGQPGNPWLAYRPGTFQQQQMTPDPRASQQTPPDLRE